MTKGYEHSEDSKNDDEKGVGMSWGIRIKDEKEEHSSNGQKDEDEEKEKSSNGSRNRDKKKGRSSNGSKNDKKRSHGRPKKIPIEVESATPSIPQHSGRLLSVFVVIGVAVLIVGLALKFYVVPSMKVAPEDLDTAVEYEGTVEILDITTLTAQEMDVNVRETYTASSVDGNELEIYTSHMITESESGARLSFLEAEGYTFTIDRTTFEYIDDEHSGQWLFPIGVEKTDYTFWNEDLGRTSVCEYVDTTDHEGMETYEYYIEEEDFELVLGDVFDEDTAMQLESVGAVLTCNVDITFWVHPETGIVIDLEKHQERYLTFPDDSQWKVIEQDIQFTPEQISLSKDLAKESEDQLTFMGFYMPLIFMIEGAILTVLGIAIVRSRKYSKRSDEESTYIEEKDITSAHAQQA